MTPAALPGPTAKGADPEIVGEEKAVLTAAPNVPPPIQRRHATKVVVHLEVRELVKRMADGVDYLFWTFGGEVPGLSIRERVRLFVGKGGPNLVSSFHVIGVMPLVLLTDEQIAHVLTFVRSAWGNTGDIVTVEEVQKVHAESVNQ